MGPLRSIIQSQLIYLLSQLGYLHQKSLHISIVVFTTRHTRISKI